MALDMSALLKLMVDKGISDIHFKANACPAVRVNGRLVSGAVPFSQFETMINEELAKTGNKLPICLK